MIMLFSLKLALHDRTTYPSLDKLQVLRMDILCFAGALSRYKAAGRTGDILRVPCIGLFRIVVPSPPGRVSASATS